MEHLLWDSEPESSAIASQWDRVLCFRTKCPYPEADSRSVMPLDAQGCTRTTMSWSVCAALCGERSLGSWTGFAPLSLWASPSAVSRIPVLTMNWGTPYAHTVMGIGDCHCLP